MALQVWLPLDGNLNNQGLTKVSASLLSGTSYTTGKIGQGLYTTADAQGVNLSGFMTTLKTYTKYSMCAWIYLNSTATNHSTTIMSSGNWNTSGGNLTFALYNYSSGYQYLMTPSTGGWSSKRIIYSPKFQLQTWYHIAIAYDGTNTIGYVNGEKIGQVSGGGICQNSDTSNLYIGSATYYNGFSLKGKINDVRIYDHCLSAEEVKRISLGLVCHLPLNRNGFGVGNLLTNSNVIVNSSSYNLHDYYFVSGKAPADGETVTIQMKATLASGKTYFGIYNSGGNLSPTQLNSTHLKNGIYERTFTWKVTNGSYTASNTYLRVYHMPNSVTATSTIDWIKLESGSEATTWSPNASDTTYFYDWTTEKDVSGLNHNGTKTGNFSYSRNTPTYGMSTVFNGTNAYITEVSPTSEVKTISCWAKTAKNKSTSQIMVADYKSQLCISFYNGNIISFYTSTASDAGTGSACILGNEYIENGWNHFVVVSTGVGTRKVYCNGVEQVATTNNYWTRGTDSFDIGRRNHSSPTYFDGQLSDVRLYATALSADDVKALYENRL